MFDRIKKNLGRIYRILLFILSCVVIIYFFPKSGKFKYSFENGRPWQSDNLYAPFDFAIKKTDKELEEEKTGIRLATKVFFNKDSLVLNKSLNLLSNKVENPSNDSVIIAWNGGLLYKDFGKPEHSFNCFTVLAPIKADVSVLWRKIHAIANCDTV